MTPAHTTTNEQALPQRNPGTHRCWAPAGPRTDLPEVDDPTPTLMRRVLRALAAWRPAETMGG